MTSRSPLVRLLFLAVAVACCSAIVVPALAQAPSTIAQTRAATNVGGTTATFNGYFATQNGSAATYHFEYTTNFSTSSLTYEKSTPPTQGASGSSPALNVTGLTPGTYYAYRLVVQNANGEKAFGNPENFTTTGRPPPPPGSTTTTDTVGPGGSVSTGSDPSGAKPIVVKVTAEKGATIYVDEIANPDRPGAADEEFNPEDPDAGDKRWYGPALRIELGKETPTQVITAVFTVDAGTNLMDGLTMSRGEIPILKTDSGKAPCQPTDVDVRYLASGDLQVSRVFKCAKGFYSPMTFHFYNRAWGVNGRDSGPGYDTSLDTVLKRGYFEVGIYCHLQCKRSATARIDPTTARKLGLQSATLASARKGPRSTLKNTFAAAREGTQLKLRLSDAERKRLRRANRITVKFHLKAVGPDGQVWKRTYKLTFKRDEDNSDSVG